MSKPLYCPCCGYDFRNKNWVKESNDLLKRYNNETYAIVKKAINVSSNHTTVYPEDVYKFLKGISICKEPVVFEGCKTYLSNVRYQLKGLNYLKYIILNLEKNKERIRQRLEKSIGGRVKELKDE
jgi:hypothetical protein